jgi:hypothetical protein
MYHVIVDSVCRFRVLTTQSRIQSTPHRRTRALALLDGNAWVLLPKRSELSLRVQTRTHPCCSYGKALEVFYSGHTAPLLVCVITAPASKAPPCVQELGLLK